MRRRFALLATPHAQLLLAILSLALALTSAVSLLGTVRPPDILLLFFGGFGAGAALTAAIAQYRRGRGERDRKKRGSGLVQDVSERATSQSDVEAVSAKSS